MTEPTFKINICIFPHFDAGEQTSILSLVLAFLWAVGAIWAWGLLNNSLLKIWQS